MTFTGIPESTRIEKGDRLDFFGKLTSSTETKLSDTRSRKKLVYTGAHLVK